MQWVLTQSLNLSELIHVAKTLIVDPFQNIIGDVIRSRLINLFLGGWFVLTFTFSGTWRIVFYAIPFTSKKKIKMIYVQSPTDLSGFNLIVIRITYIFATVEEGTVRSSRLATNFFKIKASASVFPSMRCSLAKTRASSSMS